MGPLAIMAYSIAETSFSGKMSCLPPPSPSLSLSTHQDNLWFAAEAAWRAASDPSITTIGTTD